MGLKEAIVSQAAGMRPSDLSVLMSAVAQPSDDVIELMTSAGSPNERLWSLMADYGLLERRDEAVPAGLPKSLFAVKPHLRDITFVLIATCYEGRRQNMSAEEILNCARNDDVRMRVFFRDLDIYRASIAPKKDISRRKLLGRLIVRVWRSILHFLPRLHAP